MSVKEIITENLTSIEFNSMVDEDKKQLLYLRKRSHAFTVNMVAHTCYYVAILNEIRRRTDQNRHIINTKKPFDEYNRLKIGIIGCGRLGTHIVNSLLEYSNVKPDDVIISTKRPELMLGDFAENGVICCFDNIRVVESSDIVIVCISTVQTEEMLEEIKGYVKGFIYTVIAGYSVSKICKLIQHDDVFKPVYSYSNSRITEITEWDFISKVNDAIAMLEFRESSCPLYTEQQSNPLVKVEQKYLEVLFHHGMNICLNDQLSLEDSIEIVTRVLFGKACSDLEPFADTVKQSTLENGKFNLKNIGERGESLFGNYLNNDQVDDLFTAFRTQYKAVFDRFFDWRSTKETP